MWSKLNFQYNLSLVSHDLSEIILIWITTTIIIICIIIIINAEKTLTFCGNHYKFFSVIFDEWNLKEQRSIYKIISLLLLLS